MLGTAMMEENKKNGLLLVIGLFVINVFWGGSFIANAIALKDIGPIEIASLRFFLAAPLLFIITYLWKGRQFFKIDMKDMPTIIMMAITGVTLQYILQVSSQSFTTATNASLLINTSVFFIMILSAMFLGEKLTSWKVIGAIVGFIGVAFLVSNGTLSFDLGGSVAGDLLIVFCGLLWAIYSIYGKKIAPKYHPLAVLNYIFIIGTIGFIPFYLLTPHKSVFTISLPAIGAIVFLAIFCSIVAYLIYNIALEKMGATNVAVYIYFVPLSTIVFAYLILGETLTPLTAIGGLMVLAGMYIAQK